MLRTMFLSTAALALLALPATAASTATSTTTVNISVPEQVSVWGPATASLILDGQNPQNSAATESSISYITNVDAKIDASVDTSSFPAALGPGGGIQFYIFNNANAAAALAAIALNQYGPAGALTWSSANDDATQTLIASTGATGGPVNNHLITYAASLPGDISPPDDYSAVVTYTITATP